MPDIEERYSSMEETLNALEATLRQARENAPITAGMARAAQWARVEIFGHTCHYGRISEVERFGAKMLQIEIPVDGKPDGRWQTIHYAGSAVFSLSPSEEHVVMQRNKPYVPATARIAYAGDDDDCPI